MKLPKILKIIIRFDIRIIRCQIIRTLFSDIRYCLKFIQIEIHASARLNILYLIFVRVEKSYCFPIWKIWIWIKVATKKSFKNTPLIFVLILVLCVFRQPSYNSLKIYIYTFFPNFPMSCGEVSPFVLKNMRNSNRYFTSSRSSHRNFLFFCSNYNFFSKFPMTCVDFLPFVSKSNMNNSNL